MMMSKVFLSLGSNQGDRFKYLDNAIQLIAEQIGDVNHLSSVYETEAWGFESKDDFLNQVIIVETMIDPFDILKLTQSIELKLGRVAKSKDKKYSSRCIDIDILFYDELVIESLELVIPHPLISQRRFILVPLVELCSDLIHPLHKQTIKVLLNECLDKGKLAKVTK